MNYKIIDAALYVAVASAIVCMAGLFVTDLRIFTAGLCGLLVAIILAEVGSGKHYQNAR